MAKGKNAYLAKQAEKQKQRDMIVMSWSHQMCYDALTLVLNDPEVMGKDVFGRVRLNRLCKALNAKIGEIMPGMSGAVNSSYIRAQVDRELKRICGEDFAPWEERYEFWDDRGI